ncbi:ribosomal-protein-alanine N-acetyltransferase [Ruegeria denitrificans]|uniref:Ribosomal-protein-alanine N-acetyltransferase n=1 Tax=Ruegeria denitrificans TaxID=1715692 RepID=A0A0P1IAD9_9RHOB|nr:N-acetyltransferase [Ruegeria denitrificans]CUK01141.1 ribosomal-protein-alanine N-acetyltransferase [Ruegeria denitrificans]
MTPQELAHTHAAAFTQSRPWTEPEFTDLLANRFTHVIGNEDSFALFQVIADEAELLTIATHPNHQRQGLALRCMRDWHAKARSLGATRAFLDVAADNQPAITLYQRCGYTACGLRKGYYLREKAEKADAVVMACDLS